MATLPHLRDRLRLRHLRLLELVDRARSLRAVAEELNLTQPAVSQMVKDLETAFGVALVERSAKGASLTAAGRHALLRSRAGLAIFEHLAGELTAATPTVIRLGTNPTLTYDLLPRAMRQLGLASSALHVKVRTGMVTAMMQDLLDGALDCYVGRVDWDAVPAGMAPLLRATPLLTSELTVACSRRHPLAGRDDVTAQELLDWSWALPTHATNNRMSIERAFRDCGLFLPEPVYEMEADPNAFKALAREIDVLTCLPRSALGEPDIVPLRVAGLELQPFVSHVLTLAESDAHPEIVALRQALQRAAGER